MADKLTTPIDLPALSSAPASPGSGYMRFYGKTDGKPYAKNSNGDEYDLSATGGGSGYATELSINLQTGTSYTLAATDASNTLIRINNASAITLTVPLNSSVAIAVGSVISVEQQGAGIVTVTPAASVTINTTARKTWGQNAIIQLIKVDTNIWNVINGTI
jgi:hypothetical protein